MNMSTPIAALFLATVAITTADAADEPRAFECTPIAEGEGPRIGDPITQINVLVVYSTDQLVPTGITIIHGKASGSQVNRASQYKNESFRAEVDKLEWSGVLKTNPKITMRGILGHAPSGDWMYGESQWDKGRLAFSTAAVCRKMSATTTAGDTSAPPERMHTSRL
jgi:hypothetical protein